MRMATNPSDARWQRLPRRRRAAVYRAVGRAARAAREDGDTEIAKDVRVAIDVLRSHGRGPRRKTE